jgi:hypothetical protein
MRTSAWVVEVFACGLALAGASVRSQGAELRGTVLSLAGSPLPGARVTAMTPDTTTVLEVRTDGSGTFAFPGLAAGSWIVGASGTGYAYRETTAVLSGFDVVREFRLGPDVHPGRWSTIGTTDPENLYASNSGSLLPDGRIFYCHDTLEPVLFDPVTGQKSFPAASTSQQGCHIPTLLADGGLIFIGGQGSDDFRDAVRTVKTFDYRTGSWTNRADLLEERWYPGIARLADGRLLIMGGGQSPNAQRTASCEIYDPATNAWASTSAMSNASDYPPAVLLYTGDVLRSWWPSQLYDPNSGQWRNTGSMVQTDRGWPGHCDHSLVVLPDGRACAVGIERQVSPPASMLEFYDPSAETWTLGPNATVTRSRPEVLLLPTGQVFVAGGKLEGTNPGVPTNAFGQTRLTDLFDPSSNSWRRCADMSWFREYHAVSVLVPDGRVVTTAGTGGPASPGVSNDIEAFEPPYLFRGVRPRVAASWPLNLRSGSAFSFTVTRTNQVTAVVLVGTNAATHWVDGGVPRSIGLSFQQVGTKVTASIPADRNLVPVGHYLLFTLVDDIPSNGLMARVLDDTVVGTPSPGEGRLTARLSPNPSRGGFRLEWFQPRPGPVEINLIDASGRRREAWTVEEGPAGVRSWRWDDGATPGPQSGVYWIQLVAGSDRWTARAVVLP